MTLPFEFATPEILGLCVGLLFGLSLFVAGLANPDKIIGTLRLKDFHAFRVIAVFIIVGMFGIWLLTLADPAYFGEHFSVKPAYLVVNALGGMLLGIGFGLTGYCPGTGLACAAAGRIDALVTVIGMLAGAFVYILIYPHVVPTMESWLDWGKTTIPEATETDPKYWVLPICAAGALLLLITKPRKGKKQPAQEPADEIPLEK
jgi:uncharacterized membrane protein YedE/YeeE